MLIIVLIYHHELLDVMRVECVNLWFHYCHTFSFFKYTVKSWEISRAKVTARTGHQAPGAAACKYGGQSRGSFTS